MNPRNGLVVAAAAFVMAACAPVAEQAMNARPAENQTMLVVQNDNWSEVKVYLLRGSQRIRLGSVPSMSQGKFSIPNAFVFGVSDVTIQAEPIGGHESYVSPPIQVYPGGRVALKVEKQLRLSHFAVYGTH
jgi:hypothetical protein